jgi:hypothetical protein
MRGNTISRRFVSAGAMVALCLLLIVAACGCRQKAEETASEQPKPTVESTEENDQVVAGPAAAVFDMEEFSVLEYDGPHGSRLRMGQYVRECSDKPNEKVTAYPAFKSDKPIYGTATFDMSLVRYGTGIDYCFAIDESGGTGTGYDRFYFDADHNLDLTDDPAVALMEEVPAGLGQNRRGSEEAFFEYLQFSLDYGPDEPSSPVKIIPRLMRYGSLDQVSFIVPGARRGKIKLGSKEFEAVLSQASMITGRYDRPTAGLYLGSDMESLPLVCNWRCVDGIFYILSPTPAGDRITVAPYTGRFGVFQVGSADGDAEEGTVERGWLLSKDAIIDVGECPKENGKLKIPVGDYKPFQLSIRLGQLRVGFALNTQQAGEAPAKPPVFGIEIREDRPYVFDFSGKPEVVFNSPAAAERFKAGGQLDVKAMVYEPVMDVMIAGLEDTTRKLGDAIKLPDGTEYQRYQSLDPVVKITDSSGECVAEGKMPFG